MTAVRWSSPPLSAEDDFHGGRGRCPPYQRESAASRQTRCSCFSEGATDPGTARYWPTPIVACAARARVVGKGRVDCIGGGHVLFHC